MIWLKTLWHWLLDEWCALSAPTWAGDFALEKRDGDYYVVPSVDLRSVFDKLQGDDE